MERRQAHSLIFICRACEARQPRERDAGRPAQPGRPLGAPPWRFSAGDPCCPSPAVRPEQTSDLPAPGLRPGRRGPGPPAVRFAPQSQDATHRSAVRIVSGDAPHERGYESYSMASLSSQYRSRDAANMPDVIVGNLGCDEASRSSASEAFLGRPVAVDSHEVVQRALHEPVGSAHRRAAWPTPAPRTRPTPAAWQSRWGYLKAAACPEHRPRARS